MNTMYREHILDHYKHPRNHGVIEDWDVQYSDCNPLCGDEQTIQAKLDGEVLIDIKFSGKGCAISQAAASMLTEITKGKTKTEALSLTSEKMLETIGVQIIPSRLKCALLGLMALKKALVIK